MNRIGLTRFSLLAIFLAVGILLGSLATAQESKQPTYKIVAPDATEVVYPNGSKALYIHDIKYVNVDGTWKNFSDVVKMTFDYSTGNIKYFYGDKYVTARLFFVVNVSESVCTAQGWNWKDNHCYLWPNQAKEFMTSKGVDYHVAISKYPGRYKYGINLDNIPSDYVSKILYVGLYIENAYGLEWSDIVLDVKDKKIVIKDSIALGWQDLIDSGFAVRLYDKRTVLIGGVTNKSTLWLDPDLTVSDTTTMCGYNDTYDTITIQSGGVLQVCDYDGSPTNCEGGGTPSGCGYVNISCSSFTVESGGIVNGDEAGYRGPSDASDGEGPGGGNSSTFGLGAGGGAYGGDGGDGKSDAGGLAYGTQDGIYIKMGSGGGGTKNDDVAGDGGGAVFINVSDGTINIFGTITVDGGIGTSVNNRGSGGGAGGGILLYGKNINLTSAILSADGEHGGLDPDGYGGSGGGGRIKIFYGNLYGNDSATLSVSTSTSGYSGTDGVDGTTYWEQVSFNTAPSITANATSPATVYTNTDYKVNLTITDSDAGDTLTGYVQFYINNTASGSVQSQTATNNTNTLIATLSSANFNKGDTIQAEVWAGDGTENTSKSNLTSTTVQDSAPTDPTDISGFPASLKVGDTLTVTASGGSDADGDSITYHYKFYNTNDTATKQDWSATNSYTIQQSDAHDVIRVYAKSTTADANSSGSYYEDDTVDDTPPTNPSGSTLTSTVKVGETLTATGAGSTDADGDSITYEYQFYNNNDSTELQAKSSDNTYVIQQTDAHDVIRVRVWAHTSLSDSSGYEEKTKTVSDSTAVVDEPAKNDTYLGASQQVNISVNVTDADGAGDLTTPTIVIQQPNSTVKVNNASMTQGASITNGYTYYYTYTTPASSEEGTWNVYVYCADSNSTTFVYDISAPSVTSCGVNESSGVDLDLNQSVTLHCYGSDTYSTLSSFDYEVTYPDSAVANFSATDSSGWFNKTVSFDTTHSEGNHSIRVYLTDSAGNVNSSELITLKSSIITNSTSVSTTDFSTETDQGVYTANDTYLNLSSSYDIAFASSAGTASLQKSASFNLSSTYTGTYSVTGVTDSSGSSLSYDYNATTGVANWSTEWLNGSGTWTEHVLVNETDALHFTYYPQSSNYRYRITPSASGSYSTYVKIPLAPAQYFDPSKYHIRYWYCTGTAAATGSPTCSAFSSAVDVTSANAGSNSVDSKNINLKGYKATTNIESVSFQAYYSSPFLIEIAIVSGGYSSSSGSDSSSGGSDAPPVADVTDDDEPEPETECPDGYILRNGHCLPIAELSVPAAEFENWLVTPIFGPANPFMIFLTLIALTALFSKKQTRQKIQSYLRSRS